MSYAIIESNKYDPVGTIIDICKTEKEAKIRAHELERKDISKDFLVAEWKIPSHIEWGYNGI